MAAEAATPEKIAFFLAHTSGVICVPLLPERADAARPAPHGHGQHRGAAHRLHRERRLPPRHHDGDLGRRPGRHHRRPDRPQHPAQRPEPARATSSRCATAPGGVLKRAGHTEATVDLARAAGLSPAGVLCEIVTEDKSEMARLPDLERFAKKHDLPLISIADLIRYRRQNEKLVRLVVRGPHPGRGPRVPGLRLRVGARQRAAPGARHGRRGRDRGRAGPGALRVPDRRRVRLAALRLRPAAAGRRSTSSSRRAAASSSTCAATRAAASASATRSGPTNCRRRGTTPSTPTCSRACRSTAASTASAPRCWSTSASPPCAS